MRDSEIYFPTRIVFGKDTHLKVGKMLKERNVHKVLLHYGGGSIVKSGLLKVIKDLISAEGIQYVELGGQKPNPVLSIVRQAINLALNEKCDFVLGIGGGSVVDSTKTITLGLENPEIDVWKYFTKEEKPAAHPENHVPCGVILTIAGAGTDAIPAIVLTNDEITPNDKLVCANQISIPEFDILNPEFLKTVPSRFMKAATMDMLVHLLGGYFSILAVNGCDVTDRVSEGYMKSVIKNAPVFLADQSNYEAASEIMYAGTTCHTFICRPGSIGDAADHRIAHMVGGFYDTIHGETVAAGWCAWARYVMPDFVERFITLGANVFNIPDEGQPRMELAEKTIQAFEDFFASQGMPTCYGQLMGRLFTDDELHLLAQYVARCEDRVNKCVGTCKKLYEDDIYTIMSNNNHF